MRNNDLVAALIIGVVLGWAGHTILQGQFSLTSGELLSAAITIYVGWTIQRALRRDHELDRIPVDALARVCQRVDEFALKAIARDHKTLATDPDLLLTLRTLFGEVEWLLDFVEAMGFPEEEPLIDAVLQLDSDLTGGVTIDVSAGGKSVRRIRTELIQLQLKLCGQILDRHLELPRK